jgi:N-acetylmuramoyl-L-alanine amidase
MRPEYWIPSHVYGFNHNSLGVCLVGKDRFTDAQYDSLRIWIGNKLGKYPQAKVVGHTDLNPDKTCPNFNVGNDGDII